MWFEEKDRVDVNKYRILWDSQVKNKRKDIFTKATELTEDEKETHKYIKGILNSENDKQEFKDEYSANYDMAYDVTEINCENCPKFDKLTDECEINCNCHLVYGTYQLEEEKQKIEKMTDSDFEVDMYSNLMDKINKIIDAVNELRGAE